MRDRIEEIRARGADLVVVGNGAPHFAAAFRDDLGLDATLLVDPELRAYRAAGLRRGRVEVLSPRLARSALRALGSGYRQKGVQGDPWQLGGTLVIRPDDALVYRHVSREAGDHAAVDEILAALEPGAPVAAAQLDGEPAHPWLARTLAAIVDPTIVLSFDRTGFTIHSLGFRPDDLDIDLSQKRCLITGANSGLGFEAARALAELGAEVHLLCRDRTRGEAAAAQIRESSGNARVHLEVLDVSSLADVRVVAARFVAAPLDVLVHNAGTLPDHRAETAEGLELTLATHVVGPHLLTRLLEPALRRSPDARVVWVSSGGMYTRRLTLADPGWHERSYDGVLAYAETKRAQVVLSELWAERLRDTTVTVNAMHPGWADTPAVRSSLPRFYRVMRPLLRTPAEGADTIVWLAAAARARSWSGRFFLDREPRRTHFLPTTRESPADRQQLWDLCEGWSNRSAASPTTGAPS